MHTTFKLALGTAAILAAFGASAQTFPAAGKSITIVVPFSAGGPPDRARRVSWMGKVITSNPRLQARFRGRGHAQDRGVAVDAPYGSPLDGAALLLDLAADHPTAALVAYAGS